ncbi:MAG: hypothetical protein V5A88_04160 [Candidatus Thermoplasmatota archaeon]
MTEGTGLRERLLTWLEKDRFTLTTAVIYIFFLGAFRSFLDSLVKDHGWYNIYELAHYVFVAYPEFLLGSLIIYLLIYPLNKTTPIRKVWNVILLGFWFLLMPPIVDYFILGEYGPEVGAQYGYLAIDELLPMLRSLLLNPLDRPGDIASTGQMVMFFAMIFAALAYVALRNDLPGRLKAVLGQDKKKLWSFLGATGLTVLTYHGLLMTYWVIGALQWIIRIEPESIVLFDTFSFTVDAKYYEFFFTHGYREAEVFPVGPRMGLAQNLAYNQSNLFFGFVFLAVGALLALISLYLCYREALLKMLKNIPVVDTSMLISAGFVGIASLHLIDGDFSQGWAIDPFHILHVQYVLFCFVALFLLSQFSFLIDEIFAYKRDESRDNPLSNGEIPKYHYKQLASGYALSALFITFVLGWWTLILALLWIVLSLILSTTLAENKYSGVIKGGTLATLAFLIGYYTPGSWVAFILEHAEGEWVYASNETVLRTPPITSETFTIFLWLLIGLVFLSFFSVSKTYFWSKISDIIPDADPSKFYTVLILPIFLFPLVFHFSLLSLILIISLSAGTIVWFYLLEEKAIIKGGFLAILVVFSFLLI